MRSVLRAALAIALVCCGLFLGAILVTNAVLGGSVLKPLMALLAGTALVLALRSDRAKGTGAPRAHHSRNTKMIVIGLFIGLGVPFVLFWLITSPGPDLPKVTESGLENARLIGLQIEAALPGIRDCASARAGREHGPGKCYGRWSLHTWQPMLEFYEVTTPEEIAAVEAAATRAMASTSGVRAVTLRFFREEIWYTTPGGGGYRGEEVLLKGVTVRLPPPK